MGKTITTNDCIDLIKNFLSLKLNKNIEDLTKEDLDIIINFNFYDLWNFTKYDSKYDDFRNQDGHEDNFKLAKYIYMLIWGDYADNDISYVLPELYYALDVNRLYNEQNYSSDTINPIKSSDLYLTIGNFMLLPKNNYKSYSFNKYRNQKYKDNFFKFLKKMEYLFNNKNDILNKEDTDDIWENLVIVNQIYFNKIDKFDNFLKINFLEEYKQYLGTDIDIVYNQTELIESIIINRAKNICKKLKTLLFPNLQSPL